MSMRIAFAGASGTGKTTLTRRVQADYNLKTNPTGSRSVAKAMGFVHARSGPCAEEGDPYGVDRALRLVYTQALERDSSDVVGAAEAAKAAWLLPEATGTGTCRPLFQLRLQRDKIEWERDEHFFVTDRTPLDDMAYAVLHCREAVTDAFMARAFAHTREYDRIFFCPLDTFQDLGDDPARVPDPTYHRIYEALVRGFLDAAKLSNVVVLSDASLPWRLQEIRRQSGV